MSTYPGNPSLSAAVKERVLSTFQQTLQLYKQGRADEVVQGCGLILRMDGMFDPAKKLLEKAQNPSLPINVDSLLTIEASTDPMEEAKNAFARRDFQRALDITTDLLTQDLMNDEARILNEKARERMEAQPFVEQFSKRCEQSIASGNVVSAKSDLEKMRSLDSEHPAVTRIEQAIAAHSGGGFGGGTSFVVDTPAAPTGRSTAQASDFGFTFEEEKAPAAPQGFGSGFSPFSTDTGTTAPVTPPPGFSFDAPAATPTPPPQPPAGSFSFDTPPPAPSPFGGGFSFDSPGPAKSPVAGEFDFATASSATSPDDQGKIQQYLVDGDRAFDAGDNQQAIDLWSRIFLIDVTNEEASARIEKAKTRKRDADSKVEGVLAAAIQAYDHNDKAGARDRFLEVLRVDPSNATATDYIDRISSASPARPAADMPAEPASDPFADDFPPDEDLAVPMPTTTARPSAPLSTKKPAKAAAPAKKSLPLIPIIAAAVILLAIGGWFAWSKMSKPSHDPAATTAIFTQADSLAKAGKFDLAIATLQDVKPDDPQHDRALSQIADLQQRKSRTSELIDGRPAAVVYQENLANGKAAYDAHDYEAAKRAFDAAARIKPLSPEMKALYDTAAQQVAKLDSAKALFKEQRYQDALTNLQSLAEQDPQNASIRRIIMDAHFNLGATALRDERLPEAIREFDEVLKLDPTDDLAKRSKGLAERYEGQPKDLLFKIFVKYLPTRRVS